MPGLTFTGSSTLNDQFGPPGTTRELYRTYISTDVDCVNIVYKGSIVGSPAWAPRSTGALTLPGTQEELWRRVAANGSAARLEAPAERFVGAIRVARPVFRVIR